MEKSTGNHSIIFSKIAKQFINNKKKEYVEHHYFLCREESWYWKERKKLKISNKLNLFGLILMDLIFTLICNFKLQWITQSYDLSIMIFIY